MGQYYHIVNLDKREFINPHRMDHGLKLYEFGCQGRVVTALTLLLANSNGRGGGDFIAPDNSQMQAEIEVWQGRWAGDRIVIDGDYAEEGDPAYVDWADLEKSYREIGEEIYPLCKYLYGN